MVPEHLMRMYQMKVKLERIIHISAGNEKQHLQKAVAELDKELLPWADLLAFHPLCAELSY